ncbi:hypothetical protein [Scytonema sp. NUACC26]|uniref:hypothetical protein n=1 Tax=Scytonema sp. NUACC26 TaxID=3140176 RepID=UPI0038B2C7C7
MIYQQLNALSLQELQAVRAKVDVLIAEKLLQDEKDNWENIQRSAHLPMENIEILRALADERQKSIGILRALADKGFASRQPYPPKLLKAVREYTVVARQRINLQDKEAQLLKTLSEQILDEEKSSLEEDDSLEKIIELVDEWISDDSGYDETVLPEIKAGLNQNRLVEK